MLTLNANSWFVRKYLGCTVHTLPKGICDLFWTFVGRTLLFVLYTIIALLALTSIYNCVRFGYNAEALTEYYGDSGLASMSVALTLIVYTSCTVYGINHFFGDKINAWFERRHELYFAEMVEMCNKEYDGEITREQYNEWYKTSKYSTGWFKTIGQVIGALWKRVHDKTCVMIDWQKKP